MEYTSFDNYMKQRFGGKVYRLSLSTGCTCPNRDGKAGSGGCIFCSAGGSGEFAAKYNSTPDLINPDAVMISDGIIDSVNHQIEEAKSRVASKLSHNFAGYMAYFQSFTNTYFRNQEEFEDVKARFFAAAGHPEIVALAIATRPDALPQSVLDMLAELSTIKPVIVELGLQTMHEKTASLINRGYTTDIYDRAVCKLHAISIGVVTHMIIGLPGETEEMMAETLRHIVDVSMGSSKPDMKMADMPDGVKIQLLHVLKGSRLAEMIENKDVNIHEYSLEEYSDLLTRLVPLIPKEMVVHRLTGDPPKSLLISPLWAADKKRVLNTIKKALG